MSIGTVDLGGGEPYVLDGVQIPQGKGAVFGGCPGPLISCVSWWCGVRSKKSITASAQLLQPTALLPTGWCHINFSPWKIRRPLRCGLSSKFFENLLFILAYQSSTLPFSLVTELKDIQWTFLNDGHLLTHVNERWLVVNTINVTERRAVT